MLKLTALVGLKFIWLTFPAYRLNLVLLQYKKGIYRLPVKSSDFFSN